MIKLIFLLTWPFTIAFMVGTGLLSGVETTSLAIITYIIGFLLLKLFDEHYIANTMSILAIKFHLWAINFWELNYLWYDAVKNNDTKKLLFLKGYYSITNRHNFITKRIIILAAENRNIELLRWLKLHYCHRDFSWPIEVYNVAYNNEDLVIMKWAVKNNCLSAKDPSSIDKKDKPVSKKWEEDNNDLINQMAEKYIKQNPSIPEVPKQVIYQDLPLDDKVYRTAENITSNMVW